MEKLTVTVGYPEISPSEESLVMNRSSEEVLQPMDQRPSLLGRLWETPCREEDCDGCYRCDPVGLPHCPRDRQPADIQRRGGIDAYAGFLKSNLGLLWAVATTSRCGNCAHRRCFSADPDQPEEPTPRL